MKILITLSYYHPYISGLSIHAKRLAEYLAQDHDVTVITTQHDKKLKNQEEYSRVVIKRVRYLFKINKSFFIPGLIAICLKEIRKNKIVIINLPQPEGFIIAILARLLGKSIFTIYHCQVHLERGIINSVYSGLLNLSSLITLTLSKKIITYTKDYADNTKQLSKFSHKVYMNYPPVYKNKIDKNFTKTIETKIQRNSFVLGVSARISREKGIEYMLNAIPIIANSLNKKITVVFAGPKNPAGEGEYFKKLTPLFKKYKKMIVFLGSLNEIQLGAFYKSIDVLVLPSVNSTEAFGIVQVEAMLQGTPIVASNLPGVRIPVKKTGMGLIVDPRDTEGLAEAVVKILKNKKKYTSNVEKVENEFSALKSLRNYEKLLFT